MRPHIEYPLLMIVGEWPSLLTAAALGYFLGSIPFGLVLTRLTNRGDLRQIGSGNIGATNVLRTGSKGLALATLLLDGAKGAAAVLIADRIFGGDAGMVAGLAAFFGHLFPVWLGFKGGKGVATYIGVVSALAWPGGIAFCLVWLAVAFVTRISSLAALVASVTTPLAAFAWASPESGILATLMSAIVFFKHSANIRRLRAGEEPRIGGHTK